MAVLVHERILELLEAEGLKTLIGIPDPSFVGMFIAAEARGWRVVAPHHEQAGAFMADGMWRMTGRPGVVVGNQGPGVANLAAAAICAAKENTPTIFIAGQRQRLFDQRVRKGRFQYTRQPRYFEEAMKYVGAIEYPEQTDEIVHEAFRRARPLPHQDDARHDDEAPSPPARVRSVWPVHHHSSIAARSAMVPVLRATR